MDQARDQSSGGLSTMTLTELELGMSSHEGRPYLSIRGLDEGGTSRSVRLEYHPSRADAIAGLSEEGLIRRTMTVVAKDVGGWQMEARSARVGDVSVDADDVARRSVVQTVVRGARSLIDGKGMNRYEDEARAMRRSMRVPDYAKLMEAASTRRSDLADVTITEAKASTTVGWSGVGGMIRIEGKGPDGTPMRAAIPFGEVHGDRAKAMEDRISRLGTVSLKGVVHRDGEVPYVASVEARSGDERMGREAMSSSPLRRLVRTVRIDLGDTMHEQEQRAIASMRAREGR